VSAAQLMRIVSTSGGNPLPQSIAVHKGIFLM
jgi:hypothetical protein